MANSIPFLPVATAAAQVVSAEPTGFIDAIDFRPSMDGATKDTVVNLGVVLPSAVGDHTPSLAPALTDSTEANVTLSLSRAKEVKFHITGEQLAGLNSSNLNATEYLQKKFQEAFRALRNDLDTYLATLAKTGAARAVGTAGTTPFASNMDATASVRRALEAIGCPMSDVSLVLDPAAAENARKLTGSVTAAGGSIAAEAGRTGLLPIHNGMQLRVSPNIALHTKGTGSGYLINNASGEPVGDTSLIIDTGTGTILAGDCVTFAADTTNVYVVPANGTSTLVTLNRPGLAVALPDNNTMTIGNNYTPNIALHRQAIVAVARPILQPAVGGNVMADTVIDPISKLPFGIYSQVGDGALYYSVRLLSGAAVVNPNLVVTLRG